MKKHLDSNAYDIYMSKLTAGSYEQHEACTTGETVVATLDNGRTVTGTVMEHIGATVYVAADEVGMYEMRRVTDVQTGEQAIFFGIDGKDVEDHGTEEGVNSDGIPITKESSTFSFDHRVVDFKTEDQELVLGDKR